MVFIVSLALFSLSVRVALACGRAHAPTSAADPLSECSASRGVPSATTHDVVEGQVTGVP